MKIPVHLIALFMLCLTSPPLYADDETTPQVGDICHVEADYYYPGIWESYSDTELICNYWIFLGDDILLEENSDDAEDSFYENNVEIYDELHSSEE